MVEAKTINITEDDITNKGSSFDLNEGDYEGKVISIADHVSANNNEGWVWEIDVKGTTFKMWTMFTASSKWKMLEVMKSLHVDIAEGNVKFDPNAYVGHAIGVELERNEDNDYLNIKKTFPIKDGKSTDIPF